MRCRACDCVLSDFEATRKYKTIPEFVDLCERCFSTIRADINVAESKESEDGDYQ